MEDTGDENEDKGHVASNASISHASSHWQPVDHNLAAPVEARLDTAVQEEIDHSAKRLLECSMDGEDPLLTKKRIEK